MQASSTETGHLSGHRILVVEDEYFLADDIVERLASAGAAIVGPFAELDDAVQALESGAVNSAVLDINLHGEMVYPLAEALKRKNVPFVFMTGYDAAAIPSRFRDVPRLEKPFDDATLANMVRLVAGP